MLTTSSENVQTMDRRQSLAGIPAWNTGVKCTPSGESFQICVPRQRKPGFFGRFQPERWEQRYQMDALGSFVAQQIDGQKSVLEIAEIFIVRYQVNRREAELATVAFLKTLLERNIISIGIP